MFCANVFVGDVQIVGVPDRGPGTWNYTLKGTIFLNNISYNKQVGFHVNINGNWIDLLASYSHSLLTCEGKKVEVWEYNSNTLFTQSNLLAPLKTFQFAVFYHNLDWDVWYWDNNYGQDYFLKAFER
jgi:hypothetical protein